MDHTGRTHVRQASAMYVWRQLPWTLMLRQRRHSHSEEDFMCVLRGESALAPRPLKEARTVRARTFSSVA